jgi:hypothetical protein
MAKRKDQGPSQSEKIDYLVSRGIEKRKDLREAKPAYIDRFYREAQWSEASGEPFDRYRARGHPPKVIFHENSQKGMKYSLANLDQWSIGTEQTLSKSGKVKKGGSPASIRDIEKLRQAAGDPDRMYIAFVGKYTRKKGTTVHSRSDAEKPGHPLAYVANRANLAGMMADSRNIVDLANLLADGTVVWSEVYTVYMRRAIG